MPRCEYSYYVTLILCNQFHQGATGGSFHGGGAWPPWLPLRTASVCSWDVLFLTCQISWILAQKKQSYHWQYRSGTFFETLCNYIHSCVSAITLRLFDAIPSYAWKWAAETAKTHIANADLSAIVCGATNNVLLLLVSMTDVRADN